MTVAVVSPLATVAPSNCGGKIVFAWCVVSPFTTVASSKFWGNTAWWMMSPLVTVASDSLLIPVSQLFLSRSATNLAMRSCFKPVRLKPLFKSSAFNEATVSCKIPCGSFSALLVSLFFMIIACSSIIRSDLYSHFSAISFTFSRQGGHEHGILADMRDFPLVFLVPFTCEINIVPWIILMSGTSSRLVKTTCLHCSDSVIATYSCLCSVP